MSNQLQPFDGQLDPESDPERILDDWRDLVGHGEPEQPELADHLAEVYEALTGHAPKR